jgi:quercetin dioxygenase-like cupin family protein
MQPHRWSDIPRERMNPDFTRQVIHAERMTIARVSLRKGSVVPRHSHENEQVCVLERGKLRFVFDSGEHTIVAGEVMQIRPDAPHLVEALEDSVAYDLFSPIREDWIRGDDAYLRR